jgi:hypothetical protein
MVPDTGTDEVTVAVQLAGVSMTYGDAQLNSVWVFVVTSAEDVVGATTSIATPTAVRNRALRPASAPGMRLLSSTKVVESQRRRRDPAAP